MPELALVVNQWQGVFEEYIRNTYENAVRAEIGLQLVLDVPRSTLRRRNSACFCRDQRQTRGERLFNNRGL
jgi:hypothetical protein